ncbi:hypothetical protein HY003_00640 [Candidatus Saccharibacteria bacterium]|nr:hypothetical protein [Candidatus Saccharibacteria bacterium]MBI3337790.1 hypothetical protein [Candidatus Saccharibacteria bacterium]
MSSPESEQKMPDVINPNDARRFFEDGARRWRKPHHNRHIAPSGLDTDSMDFRGVRAAFKVTETLPHEYDADGNLLPGDPNKYKEHYELGLTAVRNAGLLPLDQRFETGYTRLAGAVVNEAAELAAKAKNPETLPPTQ